MTQPAPYDWLSDPKPAFTAQESWLDGSYNTIQHVQLHLETEGPFFIACGAGLLAEHIRRFRFSPEIIQRMGHFTDLQGRSVLRESFLNYLQRMRLQVQIYGVQEGTLLRAGQPLLSIQGAKLPILLLSSALQHLCLHSTFWATGSAEYYLKTLKNKEGSTPDAPNWTPNPEGWKIRAEYIGGGTLTNGTLPAYQLIPPTQFHQAPSVQIRRLFQGETPVGDVWLTQKMEARATVYQSSICIEDAISGERKELHFSRFQNLYQPIVLKGRPVWTSQPLPYLRQRSLKQVEIFGHIPLEQYPSGWMCVD